ncbi:MAG: phage tail assembly chaperone [Chloroflexota bacterium]
MFKLIPNPTFYSSVVGIVPGSTSALELEFRHKDKDELAAYLNSAQGRSDYDLIDEIVVGWRGVDVGFDATSLHALLNNYPASAARIVSAYCDALAGARLGN